MGNDLVNREVEAQIRNMELRTALEPFYDESISRLSFSRLTQENEYLESILEWETVKPISIAQWFNPELCPPRRIDSMSEQDIHDILYYLIDRLKEKKIRLKFSDHLSDRELYIVILRDILPTREKYIRAYEGDREWDCAHIGDDPSIWLHYYASEEQRQVWEEYHNEKLPPAEKPKHRRYI